MSLRWNCDFHSKNSCEIHIKAQFTLLHNVFTQLKWKSFKINVKTMWKKNLAA